MKHLLSILFALAGLTLHCQAGERVVIRRAGEASPIIVHVDRTEDEWTCGTLTLKSRGTKLTLMNGAQFLATGKRRGDSVNFYTMQGKTFLRIELKTTGVRIAWDEKSVPYRFRKNRDHYSVDQGMKSLGKISYNGATRHTKAIDATGKQIADSHDLAKNFAAIGVLLMTDGTADQQLAAILILLALG